MVRGGCSIPAALRTTCVQRTAISIDGSSKKRLARALAALTAVADRFFHSLEMQAVRRIRRPPVQPKRTLVYNRIALVVDAIEARSSLDDETGAVEGVIDLTLLLALARLRLPHTLVCHDSLALKQSHCESWSAINK